MQCEDTSDGVAVSMNFPQFCEQYQVRWIEYHARCFGGSLSYYERFNESCPQKEVSHSPSVVFDPTAAQLCLEALASENCWEDKSQYCKAIVAGVRAEGEACESIADCRAGLYCDDHLTSTSSSCTRTCQKHEPDFAESEEECGPKACRPGLLCRPNEQEELRCTAAPAEGELCLPGNICDLNFFCDQNGLCRQRGSRNADCLESRQCKLGLVCRKEGSSGRCDGPARIGDNCQEQAECGYTAFCSEDARCSEHSFAGERCGQALNDHWICAPEAFCDTDAGLCVLRRGLGEECNRHQECGVGLYCDLFPPLCRLPYIPCE